MKSFRLHTFITILVAALAFSSVSAQSVIDRVGKGKGQRPTTTTTPTNNTTVNINDLEAKARRGDVKAMKQLAQYYFDGTNGVRRDRETALKWWSMAANKGDLEATAQVGACYHHGWGARVDTARAHKLYVKDIKGNEKKIVNTLTTEAKTKKDILSARVMAESYTYGWGTVKRDLATANEFFTYAAEQGDTDAMNRVARYAYKNNDQERAMRWFKKLAEMNDAEGCYQYGYMIRNTDPTQSDIYMHNSADQGNDKAQYYLANQLVNGANPDAEAGVMWARKSAAQGNRHAAELLWKCYMNGTGTNRDFELAARWLAQAFAAQQTASGATVPAEYKNQFTPEFNSYLQGLRALHINKDIDNATKFFKAVEKAKIADGTTMLALCQQSSANSKPDPKKAAKTLEKAIKAGSTTANYYLGRLYADGRGVNADSRRAFELYKLAADGGYGPAACAVGEAYYNGTDGATQDIVQAFSYYQRALDQFQLTPAAAKHMKECYEKGVFTTLTPDQVKDLVNDLNNIKPNNIFST